MSAPPFLTRHLPTESAGQVARLLPWLALFVRVSVGIGFLNAGLAAMISSGGGGARTLYGPGPGSGFLPGTEVLFQALPYVELALGLGLICGIFTTLMALISCGLVLLIPILLTLSMFTSMAASMGTLSTGLGGMRGGMGLEFGVVSVAIAVVSTPCFALLVLLSPQSINRFSLDAMIFPKDPIRPIDGPPTGPVEFRMDEPGGVLEANGPANANIAGPAPRQVYAAQRPAERNRLGFAIIGWCSVAGVPIWAFFLWPLFTPRSQTPGSSGRS